MATLLHRVVGDVYLIVRCNRPTPDDEFDAHVAEIPKLAGMKRVVLVYFTDEGPYTGFDATRRAKLAEAGYLALPHALVSDSDEVQRFATAMRWRGTKAERFAREDFEAACRFLEIPPHLVPMLRSAIVSMTGQLHPASQPSD